MEPVEVTVASEERQQEQGVVPVGVHHPLWALGKKKPTVLEIQSWDKDQLVKCHPQRTPRQALGNEAQTTDPEWNPPGLQLLAKGWSAPAAGDERDLIARSAEFVCEFQRDDFLARQSARAAHDGNMIWFA